MCNRQKALKPLKLDPMHASATQALRHRKGTKLTTDYTDDQEEKPNQNCSFDKNCLCDQSFCFWGPIRLLRGGSSGFHSARPHCRSTLMMSALSDSRWRRMA
jgi:hypothetical protein